MSPDKDYIMRDEAQQSFAASVELFTRQLSNKLFQDSLFKIFTESSVIDKDILHDEDVYNTIKTVFYDAYGDIDTEAPVQLSVESGKLPAAITELYETCREKAEIEATERYNYDDVIKYAGYKRVEFESYVESLGETVDFVHTRQDFDVTTGVLMESTISEITTLIKSKMDDELDSIKENKEAYTEIQEAIDTKLTPEQPVDPDGDAGTTGEPNDPTPEPTAEEGDDLDGDDLNNDTPAPGDNSDGDDNSDDDINVSINIDNDDDDDGDDAESDLDAVGEEDSDGDDNSDDDINVSVNIDNDDDDGDDADKDSDDDGDDSDNGEYDTDTELDLKDDEESDEEDDESDKDDEFDEEEDSDDDKESEKDEEDGDSKDDDKKKKPKKKVETESALTKKIELIERIDLVDSYLDMSEMSFESADMRAEYKRRVLAAKEKRQKDTYANKKTMKTAMEKLKASGKKGEQYKAEKKKIMDKYEANAAKIRKIYQYSTADAKSDTNGDPSQESCDFVTFESKESKAVYFTAKNNAKVRLDKAKIKAINVYDNRVAKIKAKYEGPELKIQLKAAKAKRNEAIDKARTIYKDSIAKAKAKSKAISTEDVLNGKVPEMYLESFSIESNEKKVAYKLAVKKSHEEYQKKIAKLQDKFNKDKAKIKAMDITPREKRQMVTKLKKELSDKIVKVTADYDKAKKIAKNKLKTISVESQEQSFIKERNAIIDKYESESKEISIQREEARRIAEENHTRFDEEGWTQSKLRVRRNYIVAIEELDARIEIANASNAPEPTLADTKEPGSDYDLIRGLALEGASISVSKFNNATNKFRQLADNYKHSLAKAESFDQVHDIYLNTDDALRAAIALEDVNPGEYTGAIQTLKDTHVMCESRISGYLEEKVLTDNQRTLFQDIVIGVSGIYTNNGYDTSKKEIAKQVLTESQIYYNVLEFMNTVKLLDMSSEAGKTLVDGFISSIK